ncbi:MAG: lipopolysaccharide kinase InaA family protein [Planctomycetota bacterium]|jgi:hypothetical protein
MNQHKLTEISESFWADPDCKAGLAKLGLTSIDAIFSFSAGQNLTKDNLAPYRSRLQFEMSIPALATPMTVFLKRYDRPPVNTQLKNWFRWGRRVSCAFCDFDPANELSALGIKTPDTVCFGEQWGLLFEKRSCIVTQEIPNAHSLEKELPHCFAGPTAAENLKRRRDFIRQLARFVARFHRTGYRHRDLYFSHIFYDHQGQFHLIDLARTFRPRFLAERFRRKDITQLYYSAPRRYFSMTDRLRFYLAYAGRSRLTPKDKDLIAGVLSKAKRMAKHDLKYGRTIPFAG